MWHTTNKNDCGRFTYSQEQAGESLLIFCLDTYLSELARSKTIQEPSCSNDNETESCQSSQSGTTSVPSTGSLGNRQSILSRRASRVSTSVRREKRLESMERNLPSFLRLCESSMRFDRNTSSWKTAGTLLEMDLEESSLNLHGWGMIVDGVVLEPVTSEPTTKGFGRGLFPTPCAGNEKWNGTFQEGGGSLNKWRETWLGVQLINPGFWEEIMDWPIGWADLKPLETDKLLEWQQQHGES